MGRNPLNEKVVLRVPAAQKRELERLAFRRRTPLTSLLREMIATMTGVPDPMPKQTVRRNTFAYAPTRRAPDPTAPKGRR